MNPLVHEFAVDCPPEHAWAVWAERTSLWWPATHSVSGAPEAVVIEPRAGGRIFERGPGLRELGRLVASGDLRVVEGETYGLSEVRRLHEDLAARRTTGKLVIDPQR